MLKRPKRGEDENDILEMQEEFFKQRSMNQTLEPAAQVVNLQYSVPSENISSTKSSKTSQYAISKGLKKNFYHDDTTRQLVGDILEKNINFETSEVEDDKVHYPKVITSVLGQVVEKNYNSTPNLQFKSTPQGFPLAMKQEYSNIDLKRKNSSNFVSNKHFINCDMEVDEPKSNSPDEHVNHNLNLPSKSCLLMSDEADSIHSENINFLNKFSENEILNEQKQLISTLDPSIVQFMRSKRKKISGDSQSVKFKLEENLFHTKHIDEFSEQVSTSNNDTRWDNDVFSHPDLSSWIHFNTLEKEKFEWMKALSENRVINPDEPYEARFDFQGYLLPYALEYTESTKSLFHHGEEPDRPGYTLKELFEFSRSTIIQQRVMALNSIAGLLEYYSLGIYDNIIDIPLSKVFFVLRIAMDENKVIILEPALKGMRNLICNRVDEASLDCLIGFEEGNIQPYLENDKSEIQELESKENDLQDFHLAEIDIITCLLRTDILQRMYYILDVIKPNFNCVQYSLQILSRLARDSLEISTKIVETEHLMYSIIKHFVPATGINFIFEPQLIYYGKPIYTALKLLRILTLQSKGICDILMSKYNIGKSILGYITSGVDGTYGLRIQVESFFLLSNLIHYGLATDFAMGISPIIFTTLLQHIQATDIYYDSSLISATHAAVLLQTINKMLHAKNSYLQDFKTRVCPLLQKGIHKWLSQLAHSENYSYGHLCLLCSALDCCYTIFTLQDLPNKSLFDSLIPLASSRGYKALVSNLISSSNLLSGIDNKKLHYTKNLMTLRSSVIDSKYKVLPILQKLSPLPFLNALFKLLNLVKNVQVKKMFITPLLEYLVQLSKNVPKLCDNWFTRLETDFVFNVIKISIDDVTLESEKDIIYILANKLCYILRADKINELKFLFENILFNKKWFTVERLLNLVSVSDSDCFPKVFTAIQDIKWVYEEVINVNYVCTGPNIVLKQWQEPILPRDWIYLPILNMYAKSQDVKSESKVVGEHAKRKVTVNLEKEKESVVKSSLEWIFFNELCFPDLLNDIDITDRFCRIMCIFLCDNSLFLEENIKLLLQKCTQILFKKEKVNTFDFGKKLIGLHNFQDFYTQFLEQFQSVSYGDFTFAACVLVPLAQRHNVKWRKLLWSEYAGCLRALDCPEDYLCYEMKEYFYPLETDESVLKSYFLALSNNILRPNTIVYRIAEHHVRNFRDGSQIN